jgi:hypothetical protein
MKQLVLLSKEEYEGLRHYGVPGMKWGVRKAIDNPFLRSMVMREASKIAYGPKYAGHTNKSGERGMVLAKRSARNDYANSEHLRRTIMRKASNSDAYAKGVAGQKMDTKNPFKWYQNRRGMSDANSKRLTDKGIERRSKYNKEYRNEIVKQRERTAKGNGQTRQTIRRLINQHSDVAFTVDFASGLANSLLYDL